MVVVKKKFQSASYSGKALNSAEVGQPLQEGVSIRFLQRQGPEQTFLILAIARMFQSASYSGKALNGKTARERGKEKFQSASYSGKALNKRAVSSACSARFNPLPTAARP